MKDTFYIRLDTNTLEDPKVKLLRKQYGMEGFGRFICVVLIMRNESETRLVYDSFTWDVLAIEFECSWEDAKSFIDDCINKFRLFKLIAGEHFHSERLKNDVDFLNELREKKSKAGRISAEKKYGTPANDLSAMIKIYEEKTGKPVGTPMNYEILKDIAKTYPVEQFEKAVDDAVKNNARSLSYVAKILENQKVAKPRKSKHGDGW